MAHDDALGEEVLEEEEFVLKASILEQLTGQSYHDGLELRFPGSQPVSLARSNLQLLNQRRYWVTWKVCALKHCITLNSGRDFRLRPPWAQPVHAFMTAVTFQGFTCPHWRLASSEGNASADLRTTVEGITWVKTRL